jgi:hypothetical protein
MKSDTFRFTIWLILLGLFLSFQLNAQDAPVKKKLKPVRSTFESTLLIDHQTVIVPFKGTFQWDIQHRFGTVDNGYDDYYGLAAPSNIRMGFNYVIEDNIQIGFGITKERKVWDFNIKTAFIKQKRVGGFPFSITYYGIYAMDTRPRAVIKEEADRISYFNQLMIARKFDDILSIQIAPSISYFNEPYKEYNDEGAFVAAMHTYHAAIAFIARLKFNESSSIITHYDLPISNHDVNEPKSNLSLGVEFTSSSHAFQIFIGNYKSILPQYNQVLNQNSYGDSEILIGFNITRLWNF